jgi:sec-independent protein translocase protein TatA
MPNVGFPELILILAVVLLVFGPGKLPEIGKAVGRSLREFREASSSITESQAPAKRKRTARPKRKA